MPRLSCYLPFINQTWGQPTYTDAATTSKPSLCRTWLFVLLVANLVITAVSFIAACIHFNTFTTLFLDLALLVVAWPILSLSLYIASPRSDKHLLQLPEFSPSTTPLSEQSLSSFSDFANRPSASVPSIAAGDTTTTTHRRSYRSVRLKSMARKSSLRRCSLVVLCSCRVDCFPTHLPLGYQDPWGSNWVIRQCPTLS